MLMLQSISSLQVVNATDYDIVAELEVGDVRYPSYVDIAVAGDDEVAIVEVKYRPVVFTHTDKFTYTDMPGDSDQLKRREAFNVRANFVANIDSIDELLKLQSQTHDPFAKVVKATNPKSPNAATLAYYETKHQLGGAWAETRLYGERYRSWVNKARFSTERQKHPPRNVRTLAVFGYAGRVIMLDGDEDDKCTATAYAAVKDGACSKSYSPS